MKYTLALLFVSACLLGTIQAKPNSRLKRDLEFESCPADQDCEAYAQEKSKTMDACHKYEIEKELRGIKWIHCFYAGCGQNSRRVANENAPFPGCCPHCEVIDKTKPAIIIVS